ncbi:hypothetical protein MTR_5g034060 [Medicago truncatula]|uniref:Uncharacterized protein n=1 Tax=Medicago truncatula TaxID=3880 RepID=G7K089_MEDTR|nr:hypothetical protein MTR_5g034060 [Medicago truncatula]
MTNFKWVLGARFGTKDEFKEAITNYVTTVRLFQYKLEQKFVYDATSMTLKDVSKLKSGIQY